MKNFASAAVFAALTLGPGWMAASRHAAAANQPETLSRLDLRIADPALAQHDYARARDLLEREVAAHPSSAKARSELAEALSQLGLTARAKQQAHRAAASAPSLPESERRWIEARDRELSGALDQAIAIYRQLHASGDLDGGLHLVYALASRGEIKQALAIVAELRRQSDDPRIDLAEAYATEDLQVQRRAAAAAATRGQAMDAPGIVAEARTLEAVACAFMGDFDRAIASADEARRLYEKLGNRRGVAEALFPLAVATALRDDDLAHAITLFEQQRAIHHELGNRVAEAHKLGDLAFAHLDLGEPKVARKLLAQASAMARPLHDPGLDDQIEMLTAWAALEEGDVARARARSQAALVKAREAGDPAFQLAYVLGKSLMEQGELDAARKVVDEAAAAAEKTSFREETIVLRALEARILVAQGHAADGEKLAQAQLQSMAAMHLTSAEGSVQAALADALLAERQPEKARGAIDRLRVLSERNGNWHDRLQAAILGARLSGSSDGAQTAQREAEKHGLFLVARQAAALTR